ncbi:hypothetical protein [Brevibacterium sp. FAM 24630]|uniref:hypothetical protein n=1 Tax=unclassified Brevibacterium TaxID=2614124 RepID=UPI003C7A2C65
MTERELEAPEEVDAVGGAEAVGGADTGTAVIEFIFASVVLLIPVIYLMLTLSQLQAASYATTSTAMSASRIAARDANPSEARAQEVAKMHFADFGLRDAPTSITYSCTGPCGQAGSLVTARVETKVILPGFPLLFGSAHAPHITLRANHTDVVAVGDQ